MGALSQLPKRHNTLLAPILENEFGLGIVERFRTVVRKAPDNLAIWTTSRQITYLELDRASDALAKRLMAKGLCGSGPIALGTRNEIGHVIGILGILKAGG
jgi:acyl-CoA synthetase (AMP-forming)/AMP-acid ligase II